MDKGNIIIRVMLAGCQRNVVVNEKRKMYENKCSFEYVGKKKLILGERTSVMVAYLQYINDDINNFISFINYSTNTIYMYNYKDERLINTICYDKEGNNRVGEVQGFCFVNHDSRFVYQYNNPVIVKLSSRI